MAGWEDLDQALPLDVRDNLETVRQTNLGDFTKRRVWFFRCCGVDAGAYAPTLGAVLQRR